MTCIIAHRDGWMVSDTRMTRGAYIGPYLIEKVFALPHALVGVAGDAAGAAAVKRVLNSPEYARMPLLDVVGQELAAHNGRPNTSNTTALVVNKDRQIWEVECSGTYYEVDADFWAIGCSDTAVAFLQGCLWACSSVEPSVDVADAEKAIEVVAGLVWGVGPESRTFYLNAPVAHQRGIHGPPSDGDALLEKDDEEDTIAALNGREPLWGGQYQE